MAFCTNCGQEIKEGVKFCSNCGASVAAEDGNAEKKEKLSIDESDEVMFRLSKQVSEEVIPNKKSGRLFGIALLILSIFDFYSDPAIITIVLSIVLIAGCVYCLKKYRKKLLPVVALIFTAFCLYAGFSQAGKIGLFAVPKNEKTVEQVAAPSANKTTQNIETPSKGSASTSVSKDDKKTTTGVDPDLKAFLDSYEAFMDEYVEFMKNYMNNPGDALSMLSEYTKIMEKYEDFAEKVDEYDSDDMSTEDAKYYLEVINRCNQKMLEIY